MDIKNLVTHLLQFIIFFLPLAQSFFFTNFTELFNNETQSLYSNLTELDNNNDTQSLYTDITQLNNVVSTTEQPYKQQEIIVTDSIVIKQPDKTNEVVIKNDTKAEQLIKILEPIAKTDIEEENLKKPNEIFVKNNTETEELSKPYGKFIKNDNETAQLNKPYDIFVKNFKKKIKPNPPLFYISPPEYNPNLSMTPNYSPFLNLKGKYCATRSGPKCCPNRQDDCSVPVLGTLCYCDHFCDRAPNKGVKHASPDCCPDFYSVCTNSSIGDPSSTWSPWSICSKTCGLGEEMRSRTTNNGIETERRPCLVTRCPVPPQAQCGGLYRGASGTIDYPAGLEDYPNGANCRWIIATQPYSTIELSIVSFNTQRQHDYLTIREHNISTFSANMSGIMEGVITTASNIVTLIFTSDDSVTDSGFVIKWIETIAPSLSVEVWMCTDAWPGEECIFHKEGGNGGLVCNCKDAQSRGWCETDYRSTRRVCEATCNPLCTPNGDVFTKDNFKLRQEKENHKGKEWHHKSLPLTDRKKIAKNEKKNY